MSNYTYKDVILLNTITSVQNGEYRISNHAFDRMNEREIDIENIETSVTNGKIIESQYDNIYKNYKFLFQEFKTLPTFYSVVANSGLPVIVTVCLIDWNIWELNNENLIVRK